MKRIALSVLLFAACLQAQAPAPDEKGPQYAEQPRLQSPYPEQQRSVVVSRGGIVATSQTLASQAGAMILDRGGNAIDAAIAANAVLGVTEPLMNGVGGDLFAIVYDAKAQKLYGLNSSGWSPKGLSLDVLRAKGITGRPPAHSIHMVTVPGAVAGWDTLHKKFGKLPFRDLMAPGAYYAETGVPIAERISVNWNFWGSRLVELPGFKDLFMPWGRPVKPGDIFQNKDLANTLRLIGERGRDGFYQGPVAKSLVDFSDKQGGTMVQADLDEFQPEWVEPISTTYHGWTIWELPPNGQGIAALSMLNIMEQFPLAQYGHNSARALHVMIEAKKLAYSDLTKYVGDPRFNDLPVKELLSKDLARRRAQTIEPEKAHCQVLPSDLTAELNAQGRDTTYLTVVDKDGNIISLIQSLYSEFGTGLVVPGTGMILHNRGALFDFTAGKVNSLAPRKRPQTTIIPAFMEKGGVKIGFGIMGGYNQAQAHAQFVSNLVDFGFNIQAALEAPRFTKSTFDGCDVQVESRVPEDVRKQLVAWGHDVRVTEPVSGAMGRGNAVMVDENGVKGGASDPRGDGEAVPQSPPVQFGGR
jgi:gamma-glutamyltranspeptidase / glutathione hydrolase